MDGLLIINVKILLYYHILRRLIMFGYIIGKLKFLPVQVRKMRTTTNRFASHYINNNNFINGFLT